MEGPKFLKNSKYRKSTALNVKIFLQNALIRSLLAWMAFFLPSDAISAEIGTLNIVNGTNEKWTISGGVSRNGFPTSIEEMSTKSVKITFPEMSEKNSKTIIEYTKPYPASAGNESRSQKVVSFEITQEDSIAAKIYEKPINATVYGGTESRETNFLEVNLGSPKGGSVDFVLAGRSDGCSQYVSTGYSLGESYTANRSEGLKKHEGRKWMEHQNRLIGDRKLIDISMPGTHDSGMYKVTKSLTSRESMVITQSYDIRGQLNLGARYLDVRPALYDGEWYAAHGDGAGGSFLGALGQPIDEIIDQVGAFVRENPNELVIIALTHAYWISSNHGNPYEDINKHEWDELYNKFELGLRNEFIRIDNDEETNIPKSMTLNELLDLGNVLLVSDDYPKSNYAVGKKSNFPIFDEYSNSDKFSHMALTQLEFLRNAQPMSDDKNRKPGEELFLLSWTLTQRINPAAGLDDIVNLGMAAIDMGYPSILELAAKTKDQLTAKVYPAVTKDVNNKSSDFLPFPNILYVDDIGYNSAKTDIPVLTLAMALNWKRELVARTLPPKQHVINLHKGGFSTGENRDFTRNSCWKVKSNEENVEYSLEFQPDSDLAIYRTDLGPNETKTKIWSLGNCLQADRLSMQGDGNLVLYKENDPVWATGTYKSGDVGAKLVFESDGNLVIWGPGRDGKQEAFWATNTDAATVAQSKSPPSLNLACPK